MRHPREDGQAAIEFAIFGLALMMLTVGLVDVGRAFWMYNAVSTAARYGARWGAVVGGQCGGLRGVSTNDWCNQLGTTTSVFWQTAGNYPAQNNVPCPNALQDPAPNPPYATSPYYTASQYVSTTGTTIVGAVAQKFDSSASSSSFIAGALTPGFDLSLLKVCIEFPSDAFFTSGTTTSWAVGYDMPVKVYVYYPFTPVSLLFGNVTLNLVASAQYLVEPGL